MQENNRESIDIFYMKMAYLVSERSTCVKRKVGCVITRDNLTISSGYNGAPSKVQHCTTETCLRKNVPSGEKLNLCLTGDTVIKLLNGTYKTIKELADNNQEEWVYSIDTNIGEIVPGYAINPHLTGYRDDVVEITFDNGKTLKCTSNHKILLRDCTYKEAKDLKYGDSCMPIYYNRGKNNDRHETIRNTTFDGRHIKKDSDWKCNTKSIKTHELVYRKFNNFNGTLGKNVKDIHHKDENKFNNTPENLILLTKSEHISTHGGFLNWDKEKHIQTCIKGGQKISELAKIARGNGGVLESLSRGGKKSMSNNWNNPEWKERALIRCKENMKKGNIKSNKDPNAIEARKKGNILSGLSFLIFKCKELNINITIDNYTELQYKYSPKSKLGEKGAKIPKIEKILRFYDSLEDALEDAKYYNHKVISVKYLDEKNVPVYDLSVPDYENFAIDLGDNSCVIAHNCKASHSEMNAIAQAARKGVSVEGATLYCTTFPCSYCAKAIVNSGITKICYCEGYGEDSDVNILTKEILQNIEIIQIPKDDIFKK